jgi:hypothetical protein
MLNGESEIVEIIEEIECSRCILRSEWSVPDAMDKKINLSLKKRIFFHQEDAYRL